MPKRVFVTGGSGFVGSAVIAELLARGHDVTALVNRRPLQASDRITPVRGELSDPASLDRATANADAVIHLVGIIMERPRQGVTFERVHVQGTRAVVDAAKRAGIKRYVHMSALGSRPNAVSQYHRTKHQAEEYVRASGLDYTILRPSMIHGPAGDFMQMEAKWARKQSLPFLFMPYFGAGPLGTGGAGNLQPVYVNDVAKAFADALDHPNTIHQTYPLAGSEQLTWPELHRTTATAITGKPRWVLPLPAWYATLLTRIAPASLLPFNRDQVTMSQEDNTADMTPFTRDFAWTPGPFTAQLQQYAGAL
jgi:uncharacterized protein YbjT (DUF2867 family)